MAKRISKKLLMGLGSAITFGAVGTVSGFGVKSIIDSTNQKNLLNQINKLSEANFDTAPDYNRATQDMFFDTTDLKSFHFGNVQKGQSITPYGWLGVFEQPGGLSRKIALTGWNGEILWVNDDYGNQSSKTEFNVYDMKYDFNTDLVFVARTNSDNGLIDANKQPVRVKLDVLNAKTGTRVGSTDINQTSAWGYLSGRYINANDSSHLARSKNLYSLDVVSNGPNNVVVTWTPNFLQLTFRQNSISGNWDNAINRIMPMFDVATYYSTIVTNLNFSKNGNNVTASAVPRLNIRDATSIQGNPSQPGWYIENDWEYLHNFSLITNPFITTNNGNLMVHLLVANKHDANNAKVFHEGIEFNSKGKYIKEVTENITSQILILKDKTWITSKDWSSDFINANLKINRNMFDSNSVVFAYPYAAGGNPRVPLFNVAQLLINPSNGAIDWSANKGAKKSMVLPTGKDIVDYWKTNKDSYGKNNSLNKIYPFPGMVGNQNNLNHNYNRLITVSPFDNTIVYAAKPNLTNSIFDVTNNYQDKWAGFWLGTVSKPTPYRPFIVYNDGSLGGAMDSRMTTVNDLYTYGPTFDLKSLAGQSINLYFNQTGGGRNDRYSNSTFLSSKIGLLDDILAKDNGSIWFRNVTNPTSGKPFDKMGSVLNSKSYSTLIYSRANLEKWYPRTWQNIEVAGNLFSSNYQLNASANDDKRAIARNFTNALEEGDLFRTNKSVDLVSDWLDKDGKAPNNYNRLLVKRPEIKVRNESIANKLPIETSYNFVNESFLNNNPWISQAMKANLKFKFRQDLPTASYQILSSWKEQIRMDQIGTTTTNINAAESHTFRSNPAWYDNHRNPSMSEQFGRVHNDVAINNKFPLRMLLRVAKPSGNLPAWANTLEDQKLFDKYPLQKDAVANETTFETILQKFVDEKTKAIDLSQASDNVAIGLGNLRIEAFLDLNPSVIAINNKTIYKKGNKRILILNDQGQRVIYEDKYTERWKEVYDQSAINYTDFSKYGFGNTVRANVQTSWTNRMPAANAKVMVVVNDQLLQNNLVRKSASDNNPLFSFDYKNGSSNQIEITPNASDLNWFKNHFQNYNRMLGLFVQFEYWSQADSTWKNLGNILTDQWIQNNLRQNQNKLVLSGVPANIDKIRFRLKKGNVTNDQNLTVDMSRMNENDSKYISAEHRIAVEKFYVNKEWIRSYYFANWDNVSGKTIDSITQADIETFVRKVIEKSTQSSANVQSKVTLKFKYNNGPELTAQQLFEQIKRKRESSDPFAISLNGTDKGDVISAFFALANPADKIKFVKTDGSAANNTTDITNNVVSNLVAKVDLNDYINQLMSTPLVVNPAPITPGQFNTNASTVQFPTNNAANGFFAGMSFNDIKTKLRNNLGVILQFKGYDPNTGRFGAWTEDINTIKYYSPTHPLIVIGFKQIEGWATRLVKETQIITSDSIEWPLNLALVKLVNLPQQNDINTMITNFNSKNIFGGNTKNLTVNTQQFNQAKDVVVNALKAASGNTGYDALGSKVQLVFKLGNFKTSSVADGYFTENELKQALASHPNDIESNELKMKVRLVDETLFMLADNLKNYEFRLLANDNTTIKKYLNGTAWEQALQANGIQINPGSTKKQLSYTFNQQLNEFSQTGEIVAKEVILEYQLITGTTAGNWTQGQLPTSVANDVSAIKVRISQKSGINDAQRKYVYGPQIQNPDVRKILTLDLSVIPVTLVVDKNKFSQIQLVQDNENITDLNQIDQTRIKAWEDKIWQTVPGVDAVRNKVKIVYTFVSREYNSAAELSAALLSEQRNYTSNVHHGIIKLWNGQTNDNNSLKIQARFEKVQANDTTIQFLDPSNNPIDGDANKPKRTGDVNTKNAKTTLDMTGWYNNLISQKSVVETTTVGQIPAGKLKPPSYNEAALFGNQTTFTNVETWLKAAGVNLLWAKPVANNASAFWKTTATIDSYDPTNPQLWFAVENSTNNLILKLKNNLIINPGSDSKNQKQVVQLQAPKQIVVNVTDWSSLENIFSGNTKQIVFDESLVTNKIQAILRRHGNNGDGFMNAPLSIEFQIGNEGWYDYKVLKQELLKKPDDFTQRIIEARFVMGQTNEFFLNDQFQTTLKNDAVSPLKIYINNKNTFEDLQKVVPKGTDKALTLDWTPTTFSVDVNNGTITSASNKPPRGVGLKVQYTFKDNLAANGPSGTDPYEHWVDLQPKTFDANRARNINFRLQVKDANRYEYENILDSSKQYKFSKSLDSLGKTIRVDRNWLNKAVVANGIMQVTSFNLSTYKTNVTNAIPNQADRSKLKILYGFNGSATNLEENQLYQQMQAYANSQNDQNKNFGILQLWNGSKGVKITTTFAINERTPGANNYSLEWVNNNSDPVQLDTSKVISNINLTAVVNWLKTTTVGVETKPNTTDQIQRLNFKPIVAAGSPFNGKTWAAAETVLENLGVRVQYLPVYNGAPNVWQEDVSSIVKYDNSGKFQVRFQITRANQSGGINVGVTLGNGLQNIGGSNGADSTSSAIDVYLDIIRDIQLSDDDVRRMFIEKQGAWGGNTRYFSINQSDETALIEQIKNNNHNANPNINPSYKTADLEIVYFIGENPTDNSNWQTRQDFINTLKTNQQDQISNKIHLKFRIKPTSVPTSKFKVSNKSYLLNANDDSGTKIKFFINTGNWETQAASVRVTGAQDNLNWDFNTFGAGKFEVTNDGQVFLKSNNKNVLRLEFTTKNNPQYADNEVSDNVGEIKTKWVTKKPTTIEIEDQQKLFVRIKPAHAGIVYEADYRDAANGINPNPAAKAHKVLTTIQTKVQVDSSWLTEQFQTSEIEIKSFNAQILRNWINNTLKPKIKQLNNLTNDDVVNKIDLEFTLDGGTTKYTAEQLVQAITSRLNDYNGNELGIFQLWNPTINKGVKINATFKVNNVPDLVLIAKTGTTGLSGDLNTAKVYTLLDFRNYATRLETEKTTVTPKPGGLSNQINGFNPPAMNGNAGSAFLAGKTYDQIINRLNAVGVQVRYAKAQSGPWVDRTNITEYDPNTRKLFLSFSNENNNNIRLQVKSNVTVLPNQSNQAIIGLPLAVAKQITIKAVDLANIATVFNFGGHTQKLTYNANADQTIINKIKQRNKQENGNDPEYDQMPLIMKFSVGEDPTFKTLSELNPYLLTQTNDYTNRSIRYKFEIAQGQENNWIFSDDPNNPVMKEGYIINDGNNSPIKIYINNKEIFEDLGKTTIATGGTSDNFRLEWKNGIIVNNTTGSLSGSTDSRGLKGEGLKIQFTFKSDLANNGPEGSDPYNSWISNVPTSVKPGFDNLYIRIRLTDSSKYVYEKVDQKITIVLNIKQIIKVDGNHLNKPIVETRLEDLNQLDKNKFSAYETKVWQAANLLPNLQSQLKIEYLFRGKKYRDSNDQNSNIDALVRAIKSYETEMANDQTLGILQLWNGAAGEKITTSFVLADPNNKKYELQVTNNSTHDLDFSNLITVIDFSPVMDWLKSLELQGREGANNTISNIQIPNVNAPTAKYFNAKEWAKVESTFKYFNIPIVYSNNVPGEPEKWGELSTVNKFDPTQGTFWMRFNFNDKTKTKNIKLKIGNEQLDGATATNSTKVALKLRVRLSITLTPAFLDEFVRNANITGNTKNIIIDDAQRAQQTLIDKIKKANGDRYQKAQLSVQYYLGTTVDQNTQWSTDLAALKTKLAAATQDQTTNKIWYRFHVGNPAEYSVDESAKVLSDQQPVTVANLKIKYYINGGDLETKANQIIASGLNDAINWNFANIFGQANVNDTNGEITLRTPAGNSLRVYFTLAPNASYTSPNLSNNLNEIKTHWVSKKPIKLDPGTTGLKIKLEPLYPGYVYGPKDDNSAQAHPVNLQIRNKILVNKDWLSQNELVVNSTEINQILNPTIFNNWENQIYEEIKRTNNTDEQTARKVRIRYIFDNDQNNKYDANGLITKIKALQKDYQSASLGIVQLWNGTKGSKIQAIFESADPNNIILRTVSNPNSPTDPSAADLQNIVKTNNIFTKIDLINYVNFLESDDHKTDVDVDPAQVGAIKSFTPKTMTGAPGSGFLAGKTYDQIATRLAELGVTIEFTKDPASNVWGAKDTIKSYDIQKNALFMALTINSSNVKVQLRNNLLIELNQSNKTNPIKLPLAVPKYIVINNTKPYWQNIARDFNFAGTTKALTWNQAKIDEFLQAIREDNFQASSGDNAYKTAPIQIMFQVGDEAFTELSELNNYLGAINSDLPNRNVRIKFRITPGQEANWKLQPSDDEYEFLNQQTPEINKIKIFINDQGVFNQLNSMRIEGTNEQLDWKWPAAIANKFDLNSGVLNPQPGGFGKGLKLEFTFNQNANNNTPGSDIEREWVTKMPTSLDANKGFTHIYIRLRLTDSTLYTYEHADKKVAIALDQITQKIILKSEWLENLLKDGAEFNLTEIKNLDFQNFEAKVKQRAQQAGLDRNLLDKFSVKFNFNNEATTDSQWLDKDGIINKINQYQANTSQSPWGILQLWNGISGIKISAKFFDANQNDKFSIEVQGNNNHDINMINVVTTIDFVKVIEWIEDHTNNKIPYVANGQNGISAINIPNIKAPGDTRFNGRSWNDVSNVLATFGIEIKYSEYVDGQIEKWGPINSIKKFDTARGQFKIKFFFDRSKSKNIKFKIDQNTEYHGKTTAETRVFIARLDTKLIFKINPTLINNFINGAKPTGNTKTLVLNKNKEQELINKIKQENIAINNEFASAPLIVQYHLGEGQNLTDTDWRTADQFIQFLEEQAVNNIDQTTNKVIFRLAIDPSGKTKFDVDQQVQTLSEHQAPGANPRIKYYVNASQWEVNAKKIIASGPNDELVWNFETAFGGQDKVVRKNSGEIILKSAAGESLKMYFVVDDNDAYDYNNPPMSEDLADLKTKWVGKMPTTVIAGTKIIKVKIVAASNDFIYGPQQTSTAQAHKVNLQIQNRIIVNKEWFKINSLVNQKIDISALKPEMILKWEEPIYEKIKTTNQVDEAIAKKIKIKYILEGNQTKFDAAGLINEINRLRSDFGANNLAIVQLWNGTQGLKLNAIFESSDSNYILKPEGVTLPPNTQPNDSHLKEQINTNNVMTSVSMSQYLDVLKSENHKTTVEKDPAKPQPGFISSFNPPSMSGKVGTGFLAGKSFDEIASRLNAIGVQIKFAKNPNGPWVDKNAIKEYDIQLNSLYLSFNVSASNIRIQLDNTNAVEPGQNSQATEIRLPLQVPKYIKVVQANIPSWVQIKQTFNFRGDTKNLEFEISAIEKFLQEIKDDNAKAGNDNSYKNAPLEIHFQVGNLAFTNIKNLKEYLKSQPDDLTNRTIRFKFAIPDAQSDNWKLEKPNDEYTLLTENDTNEIAKIKIFINDKGAFDLISRMQLEGSNTNLVWNWPSIVKVNPATGLIEPTDLSGYGKGLKFQFSFKKDATAEGTNPEIQWASAYPKSFNANNNFKNVFIRIKLVNTNLYKYDHADQIITISLENIRQQINLETTWLNQKLRDGTKFNINDISIDDFTNYENKVKEIARTQGHIDSGLLDKFTIKYSFNSSSLDEASLLDKTELINKINEYKNNKTQTSLGILQLWNQSSGVKIIAKFVDANPSDKYIPIVNGNNEHIIDTTNVETHIDFSKVMQWITDVVNTKLEVEPATMPNSIKNINFPNYNNANDSQFNGVDWRKIEAAFSQFGINIEWRVKTKNNNGTFSSLSGLTNQQYDPQIGRIQFQIRFDTDEAKNIFIKLKDQEPEHPGTTQINEVYDVKLNVKLAILIDSNLVNSSFISLPNVISGDTKNIVIDAKLEQELIANIKKQNIAQSNAPEFDNAPLMVQYHLGDLTNKPTWRNLNDFKTYLASEENDQSSNKVIFRFVIDTNKANANDFAVDETTTHVLHNPDNVDPSQWKVKYYINAKQWENKADQVKISGKTSNVRWNYDALIDQRNLIRETTTNGTKVYLQINNRKALQVQFSTKPNISYSEQQVSDNLFDLDKKWITIEPNKINPPENVKRLYIRLVAADGFVYGPAKSSQARTHKMDESQLKIEIEVNPNLLNRSLSVAVANAFVTDLKVTDLQEYVKEVITNVLSPDLANQVVVTFEFNGKKFPANNNSGQLDQNEIVNNLYQEIQKVIQNKNAPDYGILQLWNGDSGKQIKASYALKNSNGNYQLIDANRDLNDPNDIGNPTAQKVLVTGHIRTLVDLKAVVTLLEKLKVDVNLLTNKSTKNLVAIAGLSMRPIPNEGDSPFKGLSWNNFEQALKQFGIKIEARPVSTANPNWQPIDQIKQYDPTTLKLELRFTLENKGNNLVLSVIKDQDVDINTQLNNLPKFEMILNAPAQVVVDNNLLTKFQNQNNPFGNTKNITLDQVADQKLVEAIINANIPTNSPVFTQLRGRLEIQYYLGKTASTNENDWKNLEDFQNYLKSQSKDQETNRIWYRLFIKPATGEQQVFQIDQSPHQLIDEQIDDQAKVKIFINDSGFYDKVKQLKAVGATDNFKINNLESWQNSVSPALEIQYSNSDNPNETNDDDWSNDLPTKLNSNKKLWLRFKSKDGYVFERAKQTQQGVYDKYSDKQAIDTTGLRLILNLKKEWLEKIEITGNTKKANISEDKVLAEVTSSGILPSGKPNLVTLEYQIRGTNAWLTKSQLISKLEQLDGIKDENHFILKREELEVRFTLSEQGDYGLNIDGTYIDENNRNQFNVQMVDDINNRNINFEGYINVDKVLEFNKANFEIIGTTSQPRFIVKDRTKLNNRLIPYVSDDLFDIQFAYQKTNNNWNWEADNTILNLGQIMDEDGLIQKGINIGADRQFALKFVAKNNKYKVYKNSKEEQNGYLLDVSDNVKIVVEIENPFTTVGKTLGIWTRENNGAKYYQGEGGFKIVLANKNNFDIDQNDLQSAQEFLKTTTTIQQNEKDALEFVYHIFGSTATDDEIQKVKKSINDYNSDDWKVFPNKTKNTDDWSGDLGLKVGDYVAVAIRVKQANASGENAYVLKNGDHSMILPIMNDATGNTKKPGRVSGYKIKTSEIKIDSSSVVLTNMVNHELPPLDGWTLLSKLNLIPDSKGNYLGVDLKLQVYTEFHEKNTAGDILISGTGAKLVKRESTGNNIQETGDYKDSAGKPIKDKDGKGIKIYKDKTTNRLSSPFKSTRPTKEQNLESLGNGSYRLNPIANNQEKGRLSLFKNQDVDLKLIASQGEGSQRLPDFYLDDNNAQLELRNIINPLIKFAVENEQQITYDWNYDDFNVENIKYENVNKPNLPAEDGNARIKTIYKLTKKQTGQANIEISGQTKEEAVANIEKQLQEDFRGQLKFQVSRISASGSETTLDSNNIYSFNDLRNKDRIVLKIVATENDLYYAEGPRPLIINVRGLVEAAPTQDKLQHLRVKQGGQINGQGSFKVLVSNPTNDDEDDRSILKGWKFLIRVWANELDENGKRKIKIDWTDDQARIRGLENGDKVEWKLVSEDGNPVKEAYYNTIALDHETTDTGNIKYNFAQIQYQNGDSTYTKVKDGIGAYPDVDDEYPENSGFIISGLKSAIETFKISKENFAKVMAQLQPTYVGINTQGTIHFSQKYFDENYWVNTNGELYVKKDQATFKEQSINEIGEIPLTEFLDHITFYTHDPVIANYQGGFKFSGNDININNHLTNGDQMWATFDTTKVNDDSGLIINDPTSSLTTRLIDVNGLKDIVDPMSPLWYVLMALAGIATLGTAALIAFLVARHKKLKGKN